MRALWPQDQWCADGLAGTTPIGCDGGSIDQRANTQLCRIIQPWIGSTRRVQSVKQVSGRANRARPTFHTTAGTARPCHPRMAAASPELGSVEHRPSNRTTRPGRLSRRPAHSPGRRPGQRPPSRRRARDPSRPGGAARLRASARGSDSSICSPRESPARRTRLHARSTQLGPWPDRDTALLTELGEIGALISPAAGEIHARPIREGTSPVRTRPLEHRALLASQRAAAAVSP
jgi:hypothetical protein